MDFTDSSSDSSSGIFVSDTNSKLQPSKNERIPLSTQFTEQFDSELPDVSYLENARNPKLPNNGEILELSEQYLPPRASAIGKRTRLGGDSECSLPETKRSRVVEYIEANTMLQKRNETRTPSLTLSASSVSEDSEQNESESESDIEEASVDYELRYSECGKEKPTPRRLSKKSRPWGTMQRLNTVPFGLNGSFKIKEGDKIAIFIKESCGADEDNILKVLEIRAPQEFGVVHKDKAHILGAWYYDRKTVARMIGGMKSDKLAFNKIWPADAPFSQILSVHYEVVTLESIDRLVRGDELKTLSNDLVWGTDVLDYSIFSKSTIGQAEKRLALKKKTQKRRRYGDTTEYGENSDDDCHHHDPNHDSNSEGLDNEEISDLEEGDKKVKFTPLQLVKKQKGLIKMLFQ